MPCHRRTLFSFFPSGILALISCLLTGEYSILPPCSLRLLVGGPCLSSSARLALLALFVSWRASFSDGFCCDCKQAWMNFCCFISAVIPDSVPELWGVVQYIIMERAVLPYAHSAFANAFVGGALSVYFFAYQSLLLGKDRSRIGSIALLFPVCRSCHGPCLTLSVQSFPSLVFWGRPIYG